MWARFMDWLWRHTVGAIVAAEFERHEQEAAAWTPAWDEAEEAA